MANEIPLYFESSGAYAVDLTLAQRSAAGALKLTATTFSLFSATPVTQPAGSAQAAVTFTNTDNAIGGLSISNPPTQAEVTALRDACETLADDCRNLLALTLALRSALAPTTGIGAIKGGA